MTIDGFSFKFGDLRKRVIILKWHSQGRVGTVFDGTLARLMQNNVKDLRDLTMILPGENVRMSGRTRGNRFHISKVEDAGLYPDLRFHGIMRAEP